MHNTLRNIHIKFGSSRSSSVRGKEIGKFLNDDDDEQRRTPNDGNSLDGHRTGELKRAI